MSETFSGVVHISASPGGTPVISLKGTTGNLSVRSKAGVPVFRFDARFAVLDLGGVGTEGDLRIRNNSDEVTIHLDGNTGDIKLRGADLAEEFASSTDIEPGSVLVAIGADEVTIAREASDRRVIGVASGAGSLHSALLLGTRSGERRVSVAVVGRTYCKADAGYGAISLGDLLTTSATEGHAMRVNDYAAAAGAIIGKALAGLEHGKGLVPVLLALR